MLEQAFLKVLNMSFNASFVILFVLAARLLLKRAPKVYSYALWGVALFRLLCPIPLESIFSLLPTRAEPIPQEILYSQAPRIDTGIRVIDRSVNPILPAAAPAASVNPLQVWILVGGVVWLLGILALLAYSLISLARLKRRLKPAVRDEGEVWIAPGLETPFVLGLFRSRIYLPEGLSEEERRYILLHERAHIRRLDHAAKLAAFAALCLHWFNPLVWVAFLLSGRDMEMSCDESVIRRLDTGEKKGYSSTLLAIAGGRRLVGGAPLAFGESDARGRIKNILRYRRPAFWVVLLAAVLVIAACIGLAANPRRKGYALEPGEIARRFAAVWAERWETVEGHDGMLLGEGKAFLADVTGDSLPELFFLYDNYNLSGVVVYDVSGEEPTELGAFDASSFYGDNALLFDFYEGPGDPLIHTESVFYGAAADPRNTVTDIYAVYEGDQLRVHEPAPCRIEYRDGSAEPLYKESPYDGTEISEEEHRRRVAAILGQRTLAHTIVLEPGREAVAFLEEGTLEAYILTLLENGNEGTPGVRDLPVGAQAEPPAKVERFHSDDTDPVALGRQAVEHYYSAFMGPDVPEEYRITALQVSEVILLAGDAEEFCVECTLAYSTSGSYFLVGEGIPYGDRPGGECPDVYRQVRVKALGGGEYQIVDVGTGGGTQGLAPAVPPDALLQAFPEPYLIEANGEQTVDGEIVACYNVYAPMAQGDDPEPQERLVAIAGVSRATGGLLLYNPATDLWSPAPDGLAEREFIRAVLENRSFENGTLQFTVPSAIPSRYVLRIKVDAIYPEAPGSWGSIEAFGSRSGNPVWEAGKTYREALFDGDPPDGTELHFEVYFTEPLPGNPAVNTVVYRGSSTWEFAGGQYTEAVNLADTAVAVEEATSAGGRQATVTYTEADGNRFQLTLELPSDWTLRPDEGDALLFGAPFGLVNIYHGGERVATISYCDYDDPAGYANPDQPNYRRAVYNQLMLGGHVSWDNDYTPVVQTETTCTATCQVMHQGTENWAGQLPEAPESYTPGILSYNAKLLRYVAVAFTEGAATDEQVLAVARSIRLA